MPIFYFLINCWWLSLPACTFPIYPVRNAASPLRCSTCLHIFLVIWLSGSFNWVACWVHLSIWSFEGSHTPVCDSFRWECSPSFRPSLCYLPPFLSFSYLPRPIVRNILFSVAQPVVLLSRSLLLHWQSENTFRVIDPWAENLFFPIKFWLRLILGKNTLSIVCLELSLSICTVQSCAMLPFCSALITRMSPLSTLPFRRGIDWVIISSDLFPRSVSSHPRATSWSLWG